MRGDGSRVGEACATGENVNGEIAKYATDGTFMQDHVQVQG